MTIYTVSSYDDHPELGTDRCVAGSYTSRERALDECVGYIMQRLGHRSDLAYCMAHDCGHLEAAGFFSGRPGRRDSWHMKRGRNRALSGFLRGELGRLGCYCSSCDCGTGGLSFRFDIDENSVEGELWHTVTWGDSDCEEPEFTTPWTETFTSEEAAIYSFYCCALDLKRDHEVPVSEGFRPFVYDSLRKDGKCRVCLSEGHSVSCVLYHDDAKNIKE